MVITRRLVAGKPASGKSSLIELMTSYLKDKSINYRVIDDYLVLREICAEGVVSDKYKYVDNNLQINDKNRNEIMDTQYRELSQRWYQNFDGVTFFELASPDLEKAIETHFKLEKDKMKNSMLIVVSCQMEKVVSRNSFREVWRRIPDSFIKLFVKTDENSFDQSKKFFKTAKIIQNNSNMSDLQLQAIAVCDELCSYSKGKEE